MVRLLLLALFLSGCVAHHQQRALSVPVSQAATVSVQGNPSFWGDLFLTFLTLGLYENDSQEEVKIRKINGQDVFSADIKVNPGPCEVGLVLSSDSGRKSKGILYLNFEAQPSASYSIVWSAYDEKWIAEVRHGEKSVQAEGEIFIPDSTIQGMPNNPLQSTPATGRRD